MTNNGAYNKLAELGVKVGAVSFESTLALSGPEGYLAINYDMLENEAQELEVLLHEIGHFETGTFYQMDTPFADRAKQESKANRFVFEKYYPPEKLAALMDAGHQEPWQLAEELGLPERFVGEMLQFYQDARGVNFSKLAMAQRSEEPAPPPEPQPPPAPQPEPPKTPGAPVVSTFTPAVANELHCIRRAKMTGMLTAFPYRP